MDESYLPALGIPIVAGRNFTADDRDVGQRVVVISQRTADVFWPDEDPIGRPIQVGGQEPALVVGVAADVRSADLARDPQPEIYVPHAQTGVRSFTYVVKSPLPTSEVLAGARAVVKALDGRLPLIYPGSLADLEDEALARPRFYVLLLGLFAALAVTLAAVGIYGVVAYAVTQRTREIGVRMALGARRGEVVSFILWQGLKPALAGVAAGLVGALIAGRLIRGLLYQVPPYDPMTFGVVTLAVLCVTLVACTVPARRASGIAPSEALRGD